MQLCKLNAFIFFIISIISIVMTNCFRDTRYSVLSLIFLAVAIAFYVFTRMEDRVLLGLYLLSMYTFLASRQIIDFFRGVDYLYLYSEEVFLAASNCIFLSAFFVLIGFFFEDITKIHVGFRVKISQLNNELGNYSSLDRANIISYYLLWSSTLIGVLLSLKKVLFVLAHGYLSVYGYSDAYSAMAQRFWLVSRTSLFIYLATRPQTRQIKKAILLGTINPFLELIIGRRGNAVSYVMFVLFYFAVYQEEFEIKRIKVSKYLKFIAVIALAAVAMPFLYSYGYTRAGLSYTRYAGFLDGIVKFFYQNGNSYNVLAITIQHNGNLPQKYYSLGIWKDIFTGVLNEYRDHTMAFAMKSSQLRAIVSAYYNRYVYLKGQGIGSSYIAEVFYDFGYVGVVVVNFLVGMVLSKARKIHINNYIVSSLLLGIIYDIFMLPRSPLVTPISNMLSTSTIATYIFVIVLNSKHDRRAAIQRSDYI